MNQDFIPLKTDRNISPEVSDEDRERKISLSAWLDRQLYYDRLALIRLDYTIENLNKIRQITYSRINCVEQTNSFNKSYILDSSFYETLSSLHCVKQSPAFKLADSNSWCNKCYTTQPELNGNFKTVVLETLCSHYICSFCVSNLINDSILLKDDFKCIQCKKVLIKLC
jgi:hypothetical protein